MKICDNREDKYTSIAKLKVGELFDYDGYYCLLVDFKKRNKIATYFNFTTNCLGTVTSDLINKNIIKPIYNAELVLRN